MNSQYDKLGEMLKDAIKSGSFPESNKKSSNSKNHNKKQETFQTKQQDKQKETNRIFKEKDEEHRNKSKKNNITDNNVQKSIHLYKIFNLTYGCTLEDLKDSYRKLLKKYHPDNFEGFPETQKIAERKTQELISAFNKLLELIS